MSFFFPKRLRFLLGGRHGHFKFLPPPGYAPCYEAVLPRDRLRIEPIKEYKQDFDGVRNLLGPTQSLSHTAFTPCPVDTIQVKSSFYCFHFLFFMLCWFIRVSFQIVLPPHLERIREKLAENSHELWAVTRIEQGWTYGPVSDSVLVMVPKEHIVVYISCFVLKIFALFVVKSFVTITRSCTPAW